ncbi:MAG: phosphoribosylglycinamide formyltransferase [Bacteroidota bacterium]
MPSNIVIFASGSGSNAENIIRYFDNHPTVKVSAVFTNNRQAGVINKALNAGVAVQIFNKADFTTTDKIIDMVNQYNPSIIVLAGFLLLVPRNFIQAFDNKIINLHPSLLPKYGGKGMYGHYVHEAVLNAGETESGITIHKVNAEFDKGEIVFQATCAINENDSVETLAAKIHLLEHEHLPPVIEKLLNE